MAQFYAEIQGNRGQASRMGTKLSGLSSHVRGWDIGAAVEMSHEGGRDVCRVYATRGSNNPSRTLIAEYSVNEVSGEIAGLEIRP